MGAGSQIEIIGGRQAPALLADLGEICTLINPSGGSVVYLGDNAVQPTDADAVPFQPGHALTTDGTEQIYATSPVGSSTTVHKLKGVVYLGMV